MKNSTTTTTKTHITVNYSNETLDMTKSFYKKACKVGSPEYYELRNARLENKDYSINIVSNDKKRSYHALTIERMKEYIKTQPHSKENLKTMERVMSVAKAKGAKYPLTKQWFLKTFPEYKESAISENELGSQEPEKSVPVTDAASILEAA